MIRPIVRPMMMDTAMNPTPEFPLVQTAELMTLDELMIALGYWLESRENRAILAVGIIRREIESRNGAN